MPDLVAVGPQPDQRWRMHIPEGTVVRLGRSPRTGWTVAWDQQISREHADLQYVDERLRVTCLKTAKNPVFFNGEIRSDFTVELGEEFQIGQTTFHVADDPAEQSGVVDEKSFAEEELSSIRIKERSPWQEVFGSLPALIAESRTNEDFAALILDQMLQAMPHADAAAVMHFDITTDQGLQHPRMMRTQVRDDTMAFRPSRRLIRTALEKNRYVLHMWNDPVGQNADFTMVGNLDWAFCAPVSERSCSGWCLYAAGRMGQGGSDRDQLLEDLRFTEVLAQFVGAISQVRVLEFQAAEIAQYFSPSVVSTLRNKDSAVLEPRQSDVTVLFCDLRGFSWRVEQGNFQLEDVFHRVSDALGVMTSNIMKFDGAIADFQGDAALAFWGWPQRLDDGPLPACRAALEMLNAFREANDARNDTLAGFQVGIGIGYGRAIAGRMGTREQSKIGVFGPVVNLTSRLEGMTKQFRVPIILDEAAAKVVSEEMPRSEARCRRLGQVRPQGMATPIAISELLPPADHPGVVSDETVQRHEAAVDAFTEGNWMEAFDLFATLPVVDRAKDFLMWYMAQHNFTPPDDWDGVVSLTSK